MATKRKQAAEKSAVFNPADSIDITQSTIPGAYGIYRRNIWRIDNTLIIYQHGTWQRVPVDSDDARSWSAFMSHPSNYRTWTARLKTHLATMREIQDTVSRDEVEAFLSQHIHTQESIKRSYMHIAQIVAKELIEQRFGDAERVPKEDVRRIIEEQVVMCVEHYEATLQLMDGW